MASNRLARWPIGKVIPAILVMAFVVDFLSRFMPVDVLTFRSWEALIRYHMPCALFRANAVYENESAYGDLASIANLPQYRQYRHEIFSTDEFGYRRSPRQRSSEAPYRLITVGDSYIFGLGLSDDQTLAAQLERQFSVSVYNGAASTKPAKYGEIVRVARLLDADRATVLYGYFEEHSLPDRQYLFGAAAPDDLSACQNWRERMSIWYEGFIEVSPVRIFAQQTFKRAQNDMLLPNPLKSGVVVKTLKNGEPILFSTGDIKMSRANRAVDVRGFTELADKLQKENLQLVVLLIPTKYTIYRPLLRDDDVPEGVHDFYLNRLEQALRGAHIPVVNLLPRFRREARDLYGHDRYIYWRDDMHWNAVGVKIAVDEIRKQSQELLGPGPMVSARTIRLP